MTTKKSTAFLKKLAVTKGWRITDANDVDLVHPRPLTRTEARRIAKRMDLKLVDTQPKKKDKS